MKSFLISIPLLWIAAVVTGQNLVQNPGMEVWEKVTRPAGWSHVEKCTKDSTEIHSGSYSCLHTGGTSTSDLGQNIPVNPGKDYSLSLFYRTGAVTEGKGSRIWCYWKDSNGVTITDPATDDIMRPSTYLKSTAWAQFTITVKAPDNAAVFYLEVRTNTNSSTYWDDFNFSETTSVHLQNTEYPEPYLFPVPAGNFINVINLREFETAELLDLSGAVLFQTVITGSNETILSLDGIKPGIYFIRLGSKEKYRVLRFIRK